MYMSKKYCVHSKTELDKKKNSAQIAALQYEAHIDAVIKGY